MLVSVDLDLQTKDLDTSTRCRSLSSAWVVAITLNLAGSVTRALESTEIPVILLLGYEV